jgi:hypothetical protein
MPTTALVHVDDASQLDAQIEALAGVLDRLRAMRDAQATAVADEPAVSAPIALPQDRPDVPPAEDWIELHTAAKRFGILDDKLRRWCRNHDVGKKFGGRWMVSVSLLREHIHR